MHIVDEKNRIERIANGEYDFDLGSYISRGWDLFVKSPGLFILYTLIVLALSTFVPFAGLIIGAVLTAGFYIAARQLDTNRGLKLEDFFESFQFFLPLFLAGLISGILVAVGVVLLILPGIWLAVAVTFAYPLVVFSKLEFWDSIVLSIQVVNRKWFHFFLFFIVLMLINLVGAMLLGIGLLVTIPVTYLAIYYCFKDIVGFVGEEGEDGMKPEDHLVDDLR
ncbi:MAG: hypothetical protein ABR574_07515 [Cryomorphaceae bacterium]